MMVSSTKAPVRRFAEGTEVKPERSRAELEKLLTKAGATGCASGWDEARAWLMFKLGGRAFKLSFAMPRLNDKALQWAGTRLRNDREVAKAREAEVCRRWRVLVLLTKAKLEVIASGDSTPEREFLADLMLPDGRTVMDAYGDSVLPLGLSAPTEPQA